MNTKFGTKATISEAQGKKNKLGWGAPGASEGRSGSVSSRWQVWQAGHFSVSL